MLDFSQPVLAVDTATSVLSLALSVNGRTAVFSEEAGSRQSALVLPQIQFLLRQNGVQVSDLGGIVYNQGPGSFTGLRIGIGVAQGLAAAYGTALCGIPSLDAAAYLLPEKKCVLAALDARMGEVFYAFFDTATHRRLSAYQVGKTENIRLPEGYSAEDVCGIGNAFSLHNVPPFSGSGMMPDAAALLALARSGRYPAVAPEYAELLYVRDKVALTAAEQSANRRQGAI